MLESNVKEKCKGIGISGVDREPEEFYLMFLSLEIDLTRIPDLPRISYKINFQIKSNQIKSIKMARAYTEINLRGAKYAQSAIFFAHP